MTCAEYHQLLMTRSWTELDELDAAEHSRTCARCSEMREVVERGQAQLSHEMAHASTSIHPAVLADRAIMGARLRMIERGLLIIPVLLIVLILWLGLRGLPSSTVAFLTGRRPLPQVVTETIALRCLSTDQARSLAQPYVRSTRSEVIVSGGSIPTLSVRGTEQEVEGVKKVIERFEASPNAACRVQRP